MKIKYLLLINILFLFCIQTLIGQQKNPNIQTKNTVTDIDGNVYKTVKIGNQIWMAENLRVERFNEGLVIPLVTDNSSWSWANTYLRPAYCWYDNNKSKYSKSYGALYNWYAVETKILCPLGWHVPNAKEWETLIKYLGGKEVAGKKLKETGTTHWKSSGYSTNESRFTALPGGYRSIDLNNEFNFLGSYCHFWSTSYYLPISSKSIELYDESGSIKITYNKNGDGLSVRCLKDTITYEQKNIKIGKSGTATDIDGNVYNTVTIDAQTWMIENLKVKKYNTGEAIPHVSDSRKWKKLKQPAYCYYENNVINGNTYGALYNWYTVETGKLCPTGWHVPSDEEWTILVNNMGGKKVAGCKLKENGTAHWNDNNNITTNKSNFTALPGGNRNDISGEFYGLTLVGSWWTSTLTIDNVAKYRVMSYIDGEVNSYTGKKNGLSVRCIKD